MKVPIRRMFGKPWVLPGLFLILFLNHGAFGQATADLTDIKVNAKDRQIILDLSTPAQGTLLSPVDKGTRRLLLDIKGASIDKFQDKEAQLNQLKSQLADVADVSLDEFRGNVPLVRLMIRMRSPQVTGALMKSDGQELVIQLLNPIGSSPSKSSSAVSSSASSNKSASPKPSSLSASPKSTPSSESISTKPSYHPKSETTANSQPQQPVEVASLIHQRDQLADQVKSLKIQIAQQNDMMNRLRESQQHVVNKQIAQTQNQQIVTLQQKLRELQTDYDALKRTLSRGDTSSSKKPAQSNSPSPTDSAVQLPSADVSSLTQLNDEGINRLIDAEKAYREGKTLDMKGNTIDAALSYQKALQLAPQVEQYAASLANHQMGQQDYDAARSTLEAGLKYHPESIILLNELGKVALLQKDFPRALKYFNKALPVGVLSNYASTLRHMNRMGDAEAAYRMALSLNPDDSDLYFNLGNLYLAEKRYQEAEALFSTALSHNANFAEAHFHLGLAFAGTGNSTKAVEELNRYLEQMPSAPNRTAVLDYIHDLQTKKHK